MAKIDHGHPLIAAPLFCSAFLTLNFSLILFQVRGRKRGIEKGKMFFEKRDQNSLLKTPDMVTVFKLGKSTNQLRSPMSPPANLALDSDRVHWPRWLSDLY
jgi:hypothetical protein